MVEPAPASLHPQLSRADAQARAQTPGVNLGATTQVYFGLFSGQDRAGGAHSQAPAWLVVGSHVRLEGVSRGNRPVYGYGLTVFTDDLTQPWVATRFQRMQRPAVY